MDAFEAMKKRIQTFCLERDWGQFHDPKNMAVSLQLEAAEVLELFQWSQDNQITKGEEGKMADELADVLYWTIKLADFYDIDLKQAFESKMQKNEAKYPIEKAKGVSNKYTEL